MKAVCPSEMSNIQPIHIAETQKASHKWSTIMKTQKLLSHFIVWNYTNQSSRVN